MLSPSYLNLAAAASTAFLLVGPLVQVAHAAPRSSVAEGVSAANTPFDWEGARYTCKTYPDDASWPSASLWTQLNATIGGNLRAGIPDPAVCYNTFEGRRTYDQEKCEEVKRNWNSEFWQADRQISVQWPLYTNDTCLPTDDPNDSCTLGFLPSYVIIAQTKEHIKAGVDFARSHNIRLVIRNTGHDFFGRSTGYGSLAINTHHLKDISFTKQWTGPGDWKGGAVTVGAGIQGIDVLTAAHKQNPPQIIVGGGCPSVGFAGGYIQGGGHGPLTSIYGMGADQALQFEVVTADGRFITANAATNPDLFWALRGGGPSTFGVVTSLTVKTFPDKPSVGVVFDINSTHTTDEDLFWKGATIFHNLSPHYVQNGLSAYYDLGNLNLHVRPFAGPNMSKDKVLSVLKPLFDQLNQAGVPFGYRVEEHPTFFDVYTHLYAGEAPGLNFFMGGRIFADRDIQENGDKIMQAKRQLAKRATLLGNIVGAGVGHPVSDNAIHPLWREASSLTFFLYDMPFDASWGEKMEGERVVTDDLEAPLRAASPNGGSYVNEGNVNVPEWQKEFWGANYERLREIRRKWDPSGVFYAVSTPGTEDWDIVDFGRRLCRKL